MVNQVLELSRWLEASSRAANRASDADRIADAISSAMTGGELVSNLGVVVRGLLRTEIDPDQRRTAATIAEQISQVWAT